MKLPLTKILLAFIAAIVWSATVAYAQDDRAGTLIRQLHQATDKRVMVAAHRGDWRDAPENSLLAFKYAINIGVDIIELDLNKTKDGVLVIMHDPTIDRTTDGKGAPGDYTLAELKKFHLKNALGRVTVNTIPTLQEVMELIKGKVLVNLDKSYPYFEDAYQVLKATGTLNQAIFKSSENEETVSRRYPELLDKITYMAVVDLDKADAKGIIETYHHHIKPVAFELNFHTDTSAILSANKFMNNSGARIWINSLWASLNAGHDDDTAVDLGNIRDSWGWIIAHGATIIQTDRPRELLQYLRGKKLHN